MRVTIHELTGERRSWTSRHRTDNATVAVARAVRRQFGRSSGFWQDSGLPTGYGNVTYPAGLHCRGVGARVRVDVTA